MTRPACRDHALGRRLRQHAPDKLPPALQRHADTCLACAAWLRELEQVTADQSPAPRRLTRQLLELSRRR
ncbi:MAG: hypothetical protein AAF533_15360 [Acidobacteriota bacterium]